MKELSAPQKAVFKHLTENKLTDALDMVAHWNDDLLADFLFLKPGILAKMRNSVFDDFWKQRRERFVSKLGDFDFQLLAQSGVKDVDLLGGYLIYLSMLAENVNDADYNELHDCMSFHLKRQWFDQVLLKLPEAEKGELAAFAQILFNLGGFAKTHGTPGYLLLANGYFHLARYLDDKSQGAAYSECWKYLHLAHLVENNSAESIHNAYLGQGLVLANGFGVEHIHEMKAKLNDELGDKLPLHELRNAESRASLLYKEVTPTTFSSFNNRPGW